MVSVLICTFNHGQYLEKCLESVVNQDYDDFEVIVVDDCSTDNTQEILTKFPMVKNIRNEKNLNLMKSRKIAFDNSKGDYILFVDADDYYVDNTVISEYMTKKDFDIVQSLIDSTDIMNAATVNHFIGRTTCRFPRLVRKLIGENSFIWNKMFKRELVEKAYSKLEITDSFMNEDTVLVRTMINLANSYTFLQKTTYFYSLDTGYSHHLDKLQEMGGRVGSLKFNTVTINKD